MEIRLPRVGYLNSFQTAHIRKLQVVETLTSIVFTVPENTDWQVMPIDKRYGPYSRIAITGNALLQRSIIKDKLSILMAGLELDWRLIGT